MRDSSAEAVDGWAEIVAYDIRAGEPPAALFIFRKYKTP